MGKLVEKYKSLSPLLRKIEEAVCGTNGGCSLRMAPYYAHVERAVFHAVNALLLIGMRALAGALSAGGGSAGGQRTGGASAAASFGGPGLADTPQRVVPAFMVSPRCLHLSAGCTAVACQILGARARTSMTSHLHAEATPPKKPVHKPRLNWQNCR